MTETAATWTHAISPSWSTSPSFGQEPAHWEVPCEAEFEYLSQHDPSRLFAVARTLRPSLLTLAAEWMGRSRDPRALPILTALLRHDSPLVREGAVSGLEALGIEALARAQPLLVERALEDSESSVGVRAAARDALALLGLG